MLSLQHRTISVYPICFFSVADWAGGTDTGSNCVTVVENGTKLKLANITAFVNAAGISGIGQLCGLVIRPTCSSQMPCVQAAARLSKIYLRTVRRASASLQRNVCLMQNFFSLRLLHFQLFFSALPHFCTILLFSFVLLSQNIKLCIRHLSYRTIVKTRSPYTCTQRRTTNIA